MSTPLQQATRLIELERAQIGHEIHDGLLPLLFAASAALSHVLDQARQLDKDDSQVGDLDHERLDQASKWLGDAMHTGRRLLTQVYPPELAENDWTRAAIDTVQRLYPESDKVIRWEIDPAVNETSAPIAFAGYRILVEAVRNAIDHGEATTVTVTARKDDGTLHLTIEDNGSGFDPAQVSDDRFGIRTMYGRAELVEGSLAVHSKTGGPTTVAFSATDAAG